MNYILYFFRYLYSKKWWLLFIPLVVGIVMIYRTRHMQHLYKVDTTIYTGVITGYDVLSGNGNTISASTQVSIIDNLLDLLKSDNTLRKVSLRLYARSLVYGDPQKDNIYIKADNYNRFYKHAIPAVKALIDRSNANDSINELRTYENLQEYYRDTPDNYLYGLYCYNMPYVNRESLKSVNVQRLQKSDMLYLDYTSDDPGITLQTMRILTQVFIEEYQQLRYGETNSVIAFFEEQLRIIGEELRLSEDDLTDFHVSNRVINYEEETKQVASLNTQYELNYWNLTQTYESADRIKTELERRLGIQSEMLVNNSHYLNYINEIGVLNTAVRNAEIFTNSNHINIDEIRSQLEEKEKDFRSFMQRFAIDRGTNESLLGSTLLEQWLEKVIEVERTKAELKVLDQRKNDLDNKYTFFSPIGSILKRKDRQVSINEQQYFSVLQALNQARLREKNVQLTSATLKVIAPPGFPVNPEPTGRKKLIILGILISFIFILAFFIILELLDRTIKNHFRAEKFTNLPVISALPDTKRFKYKEYIEADLNIALKTLSNELFPLIKSGQVTKINVFGVVNTDDSSFFIDSISKLWTEKDVNFKVISHKSDFDNTTTEYRRADSISEIVEIPNDIEVLIVEYAPLSEVNIPTALLNNAALNLIVLNSERVWKNSDSRILDKIIDRNDTDHKFKIILHKVDRPIIEDFVGMLPPYTFVRRWAYRISHLGFTAKDDYKS